MTARLYFDWNSTTPPLPEAIAAMVSVYERAWGNPSSVHAEGRAARARLDEAKVEIATFFGASPQDVIMTSGGTEASNLAVRSPFERDFKGAILHAPIEHASIEATSSYLAERGVERRSPRVGRDGRIDLEDLERLVALGGVRLVAVQAVNGENGVIQRVDEVARIAHRHGAAVHVDAIQAIGRVEPPTGGWLAHADTIAVAAHKIRGPKGIGALVTRPGHPITPVLRGGSQERGLRPGTQDGALAVGFAAAIRAARTSLGDYRAVSARRDRLQAGLLALPARVAVNGEEPRAPHVVHVSFAGWSSPELVAALDLEGLACSGGAACHAGVPEPSSTLRAMWGAHPEEHWRFEGPVRFSLPPSTTDEEVDRALAIVRTVLARTS